MNIDYSEIIKPKDFSVQGLWRLYELACMPAHAGQVQRDETKTAFFAGFMECFKTMTDYCSALDESDACKLLDRIRDETHKFLDEDLKKRQAARKTS